MPRKKSKPCDTQGDGVKSIYKKVKQTLVKRAPGVLPPDSRRILEQIKNEKITTLKVVRTPIAGTINKLLNILSFGAFQNALKELGYDKVFHLTLWINDKFSLEKNEVIRLKMGNPVKKGSEIMTISNPPSITIQELIDKTRSHMGLERFSNYNAETNNCQDFIMGILTAINASTPQLTAFIKQDAQQIYSKIPKFVSKFSELATDIGARVSRAVEGEGAKPTTDAPAKPTDVGNKADTSMAKPKSKWMQALKQWNKDKGGAYRIPKKGTPEYDQVNEILKSL
jgi:hypothetical protein